MSNQLSSAWSCAAGFIFRPFEKEFDTILTLYTPGNDKDLAASMKSVMATFSLLGSLLLGVVWSVSGPELTKLADDSLWGDARDAAHTAYRAFTTCAAVLCILLVGSTARTYILMDLIPHGGHERVIRMWGHFYLVGLPYLTFGVILVLIALSIALQVTLTNNLPVGVTVGCIIVALTLVFTAMWVWADTKFTEALKSMLSDAPSSDAAVRHVSYC